MILIDIFIIFIFREVGSKLFNAPMTWIEKTLNYYIDEEQSNSEDLYKKVLLGLPSYGIAISANGRELESQIIDYNKFSKLSKLDKFSMDYNNKEKEHQFNFYIEGQNVKACFPTRKVIK